MMKKTRNIPAVSCYIVALVAFAVTYSLFASVATIVHNGQGATNEDVASASTIVHNGQGATNEDVVGTNGSLWQRKHDGLAYVMLISSLEYDIGAQLLVCRLRHFSPDVPIFVLIDDSVKLKSTSFYSMRAKVVMVANPAVSGSSLRTEVRSATYTKLNVWQLNIEKAVYLDADTFPVQNPEILFSTLSADKTFAVVGHPRHFNSGVFAYRPSNSTYYDLIQQLKTHKYAKNKKNPTEQDLLVSHFGESSETVFIDERFNFAPQGNNHGLDDDTVIVHYTGNPKPWSHMFGKKSSIEGHWMDSAPGRYSGRHCLKSFGFLFCTHLPEWSIQLYSDEMERFFSHCHDPEP